MEILDGIKTEPITIYHVGDQWWDLCAGPHVESTGQLTPRAIELQSVAGAYWRGDDTKAMLQVIAPPWTFFLLARSQHDCHISVLEVLTKIGLTTCVCRLEQIILHELLNSTYQNRSKLHS